MSRAADCGLDKQLFPSQFQLNRIATILASVSLAIAIFVYIWNIGDIVRILLCGRTDGRKMQMLFCSGDSRKKRPKERHEIPVDSLSALLASVTGIVLILATWPQPLEAAGLLVMVFAGASVLGWQERECENTWWSFLEKLLDVAAVVVGIYALDDARERYMETSDNQFFYKHDPLRQIEIASALTGIGLLSGFAQVIAYKKNSPWPQKHSAEFSTFFTLTQFSTAVASIVFGRSTIPDGCSLFNTTKRLAMVALGFGALYSIMVTLMRLFFDTVVVGEESHAAGGSHVAVPVVDVVVLDGGQPMVPGGNVEAPDGGQLAVPRSNVVATNKRRDTATTAVASQSYDAAYTGQGYGLYADQDDEEELYKR